MNAQRGSRDIALLFFNLGAKSPRLNWVTQFLTVAYDGACSLNVFYQNGVNFLRPLVLQGEKNLTTAASRCC